MFLRCAIATVLLGALCCSQAQEVDLQVTEDHRLHMEIVNSLLRGVPTQDAERLLSTTWLNCFYFRDIDSARELGSSDTLAHYRFWQDAFGLLAGRGIDREMALRQFPEKGVISEQTRLVLGKLFTLEELSRVPNADVQAFVKPLRSDFDSQVSGMRALLERSTRFAVAQMDAESYWLAAALPIEKVSPTNAITITMSAVASCHYEDAERLYLTTRGKMALVPAAHRNPENGGLAFIYLTYYMGRKITVSSEGFVIADGLEMAVPIELGSTRRMILMQQFSGKQ